MPTKSSSPRIELRAGAAKKQADGTRAPGMQGEEISWREFFFKDGLRSKSLWVTAALLVVALAGIGAFVYFTEFEWASVTRVVEGLNPVLVIPLMALLPVMGFPIVVVYLVAGARFGPLWGGVVVAGVTAVHLLLTHVVANGLFRRAIQRFVERRHKRIPEIRADEHGSIALLGSLAPGLPYSLRNYLLALSGARLWTYFWICLPVYVARSYVTILLGDLSSAPSGSKLAILLGVDVLKIAICAAVIWRLRQHHRRPATAPQMEQKAR